MKKIFKVSSEFNLSGLRHSWGKVTIVGHCIDDVEFETLTKIICNSFNSDLIYPVMYYDTFGDLIIN